MYYNLEKLADVVLLSKENNIIKFLDSAKKEEHRKNIKIASFYAAKYNQNYKRFLEHQELMDNSDRWKKENQELLKELKSSIVYVRSYINTIHLHQILLFKFMWVVESRSKGENKDIDNAPLLFDELVDSINYFDSYDKKLLKVFFRIRNTFLHTPVEIIVSEVNKENIDELLQLFDELEEMDSMINTKIMRDVITSADNRVQEMHI